MRIQSLSLHNFRNFGEVGEVEFPPAHLLIAVAPNATGKTNFMEAVVTLLRGRSFRASHQECVRWGQDSFVVKGSIVHRSAVKKLAVQYHTTTRKLRIEEDSAPTSPVTFFSQYPLVLFVPEDTFMFTRGPAHRRNFLNTTLASSPQYISAIVQYHRALRQRNAALKNAKEIGDVEAWTDLLTTHASPVWASRQAFTSFIQNHINMTYRDGGRSNGANLAHPSITTRLCTGADASYHHARQRKNDDCGAVRYA